MDTGAGQNMLDIQNLWPKVQQQAQTQRHEPLPLPQQHSQGSYKGKLEGRVEKKVKALPIASIRLMPPQQQQRAAIQNLNQPTHDNTSHHQVATSQQ